MITTFRVLPLPLFLLIFNCGVATLVLLSWNNATLYFSLTIDPEQCCYIVVIPHLRPYCKHYVQITHFQPVTGITLLIAISGVLTGLFKYMFSPTHKQSVRGSFLWNEVLARQHTCSPLASSAFLSLVECLCWIRKSWSVTWNTPFYLTSVYG